MVEPGVNDPSESAFVLCSLLLSGLSQDTLDASVQSFQQERLGKITDLKDQLVAAQHSQSKAIEERHAALLRRWEQLLAACAAHRQKLLEKQLPLQKVNGKR